MILNSEITQNPIFKKHYITRYVIYVTMQNYKVSYTSFTVVNKTQVKFVHQNNPKADEKRDSEKYTEAAIRLETKLTH